MLENEMIKLEVLRKYLENGLDVKQLADEYGLSTVTINNWGRDYIESDISVEEAKLFQKLNATQLRYKLISLYREKCNKERYKLIEHYDCISILDSIIKSKDSEDYTNYSFIKNERDLMDIYYEVEREDNKIIRIYIFDNHTFSSNILVDDKRYNFELTPEFVQIVYFNQHPFPSAFDRDVVIKIYDLIDMESFINGYIDLNIFEDLAYKLIPEQAESLLIVKKKEIIVQKVILSLDLLMSLNIIEYSNVELKDSSNNVNKILKEKFLFKEMKWINEKEGKIRIYLSRILSEDWVIRKFKEEIYKKKGDYSGVELRKIKKDNNQNDNIDSIRPEN